MKEVTKDMIIGDMLAQDMSIAAILMNAGMHCIGCPSSQGESLKEACLVHGMKEEKVVAVIIIYLHFKYFKIK